LIEKPHQHQQDTHQHWNHDPVYKEGAYNSS